MTKTEYLESQRGKTYTESVAQQPMETVIGSIRGDNLRNVVDILAKGLQDRLDFMVLPEAAKPIRTALIVVFRYMNLANYQINLSIQENAELLQAAVGVGLVTQAESDKFFELASYQRPVHNITRQDCIDYFNPDWNAIEPTHNRAFTVTLTEALPEQASIIVQYKEIYDGWESAWKPATALNVHQQGKYRADTPYNGYERRFQWRCEYAVVGSVAVL